MVCFVVAIRRRGRLSCVHIKRSWRWSHPFLVIKELEFFPRQNLCTLFMYYNISYYKYLHVLTAYCDLRVIARFLLFDPIIYRAGV